MTQVRIVRPWTGNALWDLTPGRSRRWGEVCFHEQADGPADYVVVFNWVEQPVKVVCDPRRVWLVVLEPPNELYRIQHFGAQCYGRVFHTDSRLQSPRHVAGSSAVFWLVNRSYDELKACAPPEKTRSLSWITSSVSLTRGHRERMRFLARLQQRVPLDLYGRGFTPIAEKWDGLAPYRYSLAVESYRSPYYWTEKIVDALLAWCLPIYCGCTRMAEYLPAEAMVCFELDDPDAPRKIQEVAQSDLWLKRREAIAAARQMILDRHQLFPWVVERIRQFPQREDAPQPREVRLYNPVPLGRGMLDRVRRRVVQRFPAVLPLLGRHG
jgi:hypothetical protein